MWGEGAAVGTASVGQLRDVGGQGHPRREDRVAPDLGGAEELSRTPRSRVQVLGFCRASCRGEEKEEAA